MNTDEPDYDDWWDDEDEEEITPRWAWGGLILLVLLIALVTLAIHDSYGPGWVKLPSDRVVQCDYLETHIVDGDYSFECDGQMFYAVDSTSTGWAGR